MKCLRLLVVICFISLSLNAQYAEPPAVHSNMKVDDAGNMYIDIDGLIAYELVGEPYYTLERFKGKPQGNNIGISFDFGRDFNGLMYYGFIPYQDMNHPQPVYFRSPAIIKKGKASVRIKDHLSGRYDMIAWEKKGQGTLGYRVLNEKGEVIYDGKVSFSGAGPFEVVPTIIEGPFINKLSHNSAVISFTTSEEIETDVMVNNEIFTDGVPKTYHEILISSLSANTNYDYTIKYGDFSQSYQLKTAPAPGTRSEFSFAYASDSRSGNGGGERDVYGANHYIMKKIMALASFKNVSFMQFSGDLVDGYVMNSQSMDLQYANWKRSVEQFAHYFPIYVSMGNHESVMMSFATKDDQRVSVNRFPYDTQSSEAVFARNFTLPTNGPESEDGASYDPDTTKIDFPSYSENVYYYTYDNVAVVVLNSNYFYAPSSYQIPAVSGGLHGYIMDEQMEWFRKTILELEENPNIDHIFLTQHTPCFPNGGHVSDDMWYNGNNDFRPYVAGKPLEKGIIERRDEILDLIVNQSSKVCGILTGDEHNYCKTEIGPNTNIYPPNYEGEKIGLLRTIYQINNGAAGAPYYAQEKTPWTPFASGFSTQNALVFFHVDGLHIEMEVLNPDTMERIDYLHLR